MGNGDTGSSAGFFTPKLLTPVTAKLTFTIPQGSHISREMEVPQDVKMTWDESTKAVIRITDNQGMSHDCEFTPAQGLNAPLVCTEKDIVELLGSAPSISLINGKVKMELLTNAHTNLTFEVLHIDTNGKQVFP